MKVSNTKHSARLSTAILIGSLLPCVALFSSGCSLSYSTSVPDRITGTEAVEVGQNQNNTVPGFYAVFDDKSRSVKSARIIPFQEQDLLALIVILRKTGGELSFGLIGESSNRPLLRLRILAPPERPIRRESPNAFERAEQESAFQEELENYKFKHQRWEADVNQRVNVFMEVARARLQEPARDRVTDISSALERAELFLNEPGVAGEAHRYILLNSDGIDTTRRKLVEIKSGARLLLINGSGSLGTLAPLRPLRFESKEAALDFLTTTELGRNK